jgi:hypothetical protein
LHRTLPAISTVHAADGHGTSGAPQVHEQAYCPGLAAGLH